MINLTKNKTIIVDVVFTIFLGALGFVFSPVTNFLQQYGREKKYKLWTIKDLNQFTCDQIDLNDEPPEIKVEDIKKSIKQKDTIKNYLFLIDQTFLTEKKLDSNEKFRKLLSDNILYEMTRQETIKKNLDSCSTSKLILLFLLKELLKNQHYEFNVSIIVMDGSRSLSDIGGKSQYFDVKENAESKFLRLFNSIVSYSNMVPTTEQCSEFCNVFDRISEVYLNESERKKEKSEIIFISDFIHEPFCNERNEPSVEERDNKIKKISDYLKDIVESKGDVVYKFIRIPILINNKKNDKIFFYSHIKSLFQYNYLDVEIADVGLSKFIEELRLMLHIPVFSEKVIEFYDMATEVGETDYKSYINFNAESNLSRYLLTFYSTEGVNFDFEYEAKLDKGHFNLNTPYLLNPSQTGAIYKLKQKDEDFVSDDNIKLRLFDCSNNTCFFLRVVFRQKMPYFFAVIFLILTSLFINTIIFTIFISSINAFAAKNDVMPALKGLIAMLVVLMVIGFFYINWPFFSLASDHFKDVFLPYLFSLIGAFFIIYIFLREKKDAINSQKKQHIIY